MYRKDLFHVNVSPLNARSLGGRQFHAHVNMCICVHIYIRIYIYIYTGMLYILHMYIYIYALNTYTALAFVPVQWNNNEAGKGFHLGGQEGRKKSGPCTPKAMEESSHRVGIVYYVCIIYI